MSFALRASAVTLLLSVALALLFSVNPPRTAAAVPKGTYRGITSDLAAVQIEVDGLSILSFSVGQADPAIPNQCAMGASSIGESVGGGSFSIGNATQSSTGLRTDVNYSGFIDQKGVATGTAKALPTSNNPCEPRSVTWAAVLDPGTTSPVLNVNFVGTTDQGGTVSFRTTTPNNMAAFVLVAAPGCQPISSSASATLSLATNVVGLADQARTFAVRTWVAGDQAIGVFAITAAAAPRCQALVGTFSAKVGAAPTATPTPAPSSGGTGGVVGSIPAAGAAGLLVSGGATSGPDLVSQLGSRGCTVASLGVLRSGTWSIFIPGAPAVVNSAFPSSLAASTPFYVRCG